MLKHLLLSTCLSIAAVAPATAAYADLESLRVGDWLVRTQHDVTVRYQPIRCIVSSVVPAGQVSTILSFALSSNPAERGTGQGVFFLNLYNSGWQLGPDSAGSATFVVADAIDVLTVGFRRASDHEMSAEAAYQDERYSLMYRILDSDRALRGRFPNGQTFSIPAGGDALQDAFASCYQRMEDAQNGIAPSTAPAHR